MNSQVYLVIIFIMFSIRNSYCAKLPSTFKRCSLKDENLNTCLSDAVEDAISQLKVSIPSINLPSLNPLVIPSLQIGAGKGAVGVDQNYKNVKLYGFNKPKNTNVKYDINKNILKGSVDFDQIIMKADYKVNGKILLLPVTGTGPSTIILDKVHCEISFDIEEYKKHGTTYLRSLQTKLKLYPDHITFNFENLFDGDKKLGDSINKVINDNWADVYKDIQDQYDEAFSQIVGGFFNIVFSKVAKGDVFIIP